MKGKKIKLFLTTFVLTIITLGNISVYASFNTEDLKRGKLLSSKYICTENFKIGDENETSSDDGTKIYTKDVKVQKKFKKVNDKQDFEHQGDLGLNVTFEYDKNGNVKSKNIEKSKQSEYWKIKNLAQVYPSDKCCIVSNRYCAYKKNALGTVGRHVLEGHIDVICSANGDLFINTELD